MIYILLFLLLFTVFWILQIAKTVSDIYYHDSTDTKGIPKMDILRSIYIPGYRIYLWVLNIKHMINKNYK